MLAVVKTERGDGHVRLQEHPVPVPGPGWVAIAVRYAGICGTDVHILHDHFPYWPPVIMGHEFFGTVTSVGADVDPQWLGARVACEPHSLACGTCHLCRRGNAELCGTKRSPGWGIDGAFAPVVIMPAHLLHRVPATMTDRVAALTEPMAVVVTALARARVEAGDTVVVVGPGPVGILSAIAARTMGAANVLVVGRAWSDRLRFALSLGLPTALDDAAGDLIRDLTDGRGADLVVEATGSAQGIALGLAIVRRRGRMAAIGLSGLPSLPVPWDLAVTRAVELTFSMSSNYTAWEPAITILAGAPELEGLSTVFPLADWEDAFTAVAERTVIKALLDPTLEATG
jgi:L-iditol 2-dehydrogenase